MSDFYQKAEEESKLIKEGYDRAMIAVRTILDEQQNPYPMDVFLWDNEETLDFNRGRFNQHCFEICENFRGKLLAEIAETTGFSKEGGKKMKKETKIIIDLINELSGTKNLKDAREGQLEIYRKSSYRRFKDREMHGFISSLQVGVLFGLLSRLGLWDDSKRELSPLIGQGGKRK